MSFIQVQCIYVAVPVLMTLMSGAGTFVSKRFGRVQTMVLLKLFGDKGMGIEQTMAPSNLGFLIHRCNEFMFLMLGEGVLAMVAAYSNISMEDSAVFNSTTLTAGA